MIFINILDAQTQAVQRVISRKALDAQFQAATTDTERNALKAQIRETQWVLDQANKYIIQNGLTALGYSLDLFSVDELVKTPWSNENQIPNTVRYDIATSTGNPIDEIIMNNEDLVAQLNVLIVETASLLRQSKDKLAAARLLPENNDKRTQAILDSKSSILAFSSSLEKLIKDRNALTQTDLTLPSVAAQTTDAFSAGIRAAIQESLDNKINYISNPNDLNAALSMRKKALDAYYTAKNELDLKIAKERLDRVNASLAPDVPITRLTLSDQDILLTGVILKIEDLNTEIEPKTERLNDALLAYQNARDGGNPTLIAETKAEYDAANADYDVTLHEIQKQYDALLGFQKSFGDTGMFPGSNTTTSYTPTPAFDGVDKDGNSTAYPLIWDTEESRFVSQKDAKADPGRYLETTYTNRPSTIVDNDADKMQVILSKQYKEAAKAEADYTYKKETELLVAQNQYRAEAIADRNADIVEIENDLAARKADTKNPLSDEEFLQYQTKLNTLKSENAVDDKVISDNSKTIVDAQTKRDINADPMAAWQTTQAQAQAVTDGTNRKVIEEAPSQVQAQTLAKEYYDAKSESQLAARQYNSAESLTNQALEKGKADAIASGMSPELAADPDNWTNDALKSEYDNNKNLQDAARENLVEKQEKEETQAEDALSYINSLPGTEEEKQKIAESQGFRVTDLTKSAEYDRESRTSAIQEQLEQEVDDLKGVKHSNEVAKDLAVIALEDAKNETPPDLEKIAELEKEIAQYDTNLEAINKNLENAEEALKNSEQEIANQLAEERAEEEKAQDFSNNGFEGINNSAPFYMQFPTLTAISDFRLKNGLDPYGEKSTDDIARDAVVFKIFETVPGVARTEEVKLPGGGKYLRNVPEKTNVNTIGSFTIYPANQDWLSQSHTHSYKSGDQDLIASTLQGGLNLVSGLESIMRLTNAGMNSLQSGNLKGNDPAGNVYNRKVDVLDYYDSSDKQTLDITFNLFTRNNFLNDIFRPVMFLTALGYPKRALAGDFGKLVDKNLKGVSDIAAKFPDSPIALLLKQGADTLKGAGIDIDDIENKLSTFGGIGPYRYFVSKRPEYMTIRHASGLFYFPVAYIRGFKYTFKGPWYNYNGNPIGTTTDLDSLVSNKIESLTPPSNKTFRENVNEIFTNTARNIRETFRPPPKPVPRPGDKENRVAGTAGGLLEMSDQDIKFIRHNGLPFAYPSWAECTISISNATPFFRDDFMALFYESQKGGDELVTLTQKLTNQEQFAFNGRKARDNIGGGPRIQG